MKDWIKISIIICTYGFFRELRPSEPFVTEFLSGDWRNISSETVNRDVYPVGTYSYLGFLVVVFLITDVLRWVRLFGITLINVYKLYFQIQADYYIISLICDSYLCHLIMDHIFICITGALLDPMTFFKS